VLAAGPSYPVSLFTDVEERLLRSHPPSQECLTPSDTALLRGAFPQLLRNFSEADAVRLMLLGLHDSDAVGCMEHGVKKESAASASVQNPVDPVFRMAADMSRCFSLPRPLASAAPPPLAAVTCASAPSDPAAACSGPISHPDSDDLAQKLRDIKISDDATVVADMTAKLRRAGIFGLEDLQGLSPDEVKEAVAELKLNAVQLRRLCAAVTKP